MRHIRISRLLVLSAVFDFLQAAVGLVLSLIFAVFFTMACFSLSGFAVAILLDGTLYGLLGWARPAALNDDGITGNFTYDLIQLLGPASGPRLLVFATLSLAMLVGLVIARKVRAMPIGRAKLALLVLVLVLHLWVGLPNLFTESGRNVWLFVVLLLGLPLLVGWNIGAWLTGTLHIDLASSINSVIDEKTYSDVLAMAPLLGFGFVLTYLWVECLRSLSYLTDREYRVALWRGVWLQRLKLPGRQWPDRGSLVWSSVPVVGGLLIAMAVVGASLGGLTLLVTTWPAPFIIAIAQQAVALFGPGAAGLAYFCYGFFAFAAALCWTIARISGRQLDVFVEIAGWCCVMIVVTALLDRLPDEQIRQQNLWMFSFMIGPGVILALVQRSVIWLGLVRGWERLQAALQPPLATREAAGSAPALYLRAFKDDHLTLSGGFDLLDFLLGRLRRRARFEEIIAGRILNWRPVVALGNPHVAFQFYGALKRQVDDDDWQAEVAYWNERSVYAVMIANQTENVGWEVALIKSTSRDRRAIFVLTSGEMAQQFFEYYALLPEDEQNQIPRSALITYFDPEYGWTCIEAWRRNYAGYQIAMEIALSRIEWHLRSSTQALVADAATA